MENWTQTRDRSYPSSVDSFGCCDWTSNRETRWWRQQKSHSYFTTNHVWSENRSTGKACTQIWRNREVIPTSAWISIASWSRCISPSIVSKQIFDWPTTQTWCVRWLYTHITHWDSARWSPSKTFSWSLHLCFPSVSKRPIHLFCCWQLRFFWGHSRG